VFAFPRNLPEWQRLRVPDAPDGAGNPPDENLARFLDGKPSYSNSIVAVVESPLPYTEIAGALQIRGWAASPAGTKSVTACFDMGRICVEVPRRERADVRRDYPWYLLDDSAGFDLTMPRRPSGIPQGTDLEIRVTDHAGRRAVLNSIPIDWR
jgi:hypothetical protein